jgi:hypothetical protein
LIVLTSWGLQAMGRTPFQFALVATIFACALDITSAHAQPARVFVAAQGSDSNACTFAAPCRTFQHAHDMVAAGGEIDVLDPAGYGPLTITKAISIQGHGFAGLAVPSGTGVTISAGSSDKINLRGLLIDGVGTGLYGILFTAGLSLNIQDSLIRNFSSHGIAFHTTVAAYLSVLDTVLNDNGGIGVNVNPSGVAKATVSIDRSQANQNTTGVGVQGAGPSNVLVRGTTLNNNLSGIYLGSASSLLRLAHSTVSGNVTGLSISSGTLLSYGDNNIDGNDTDGTPTNTILTK